MPERFTGLRETYSRDFNDRTARNVRDSDATAIFTTAPPPLSGGTLFTLQEAEQQGKPCLHLARRAPAALKPRCLSRFMSNAISPSVESPAGRSSTGA